MMKVGILSMQKVMNYGSFLQAFALKKTIEELGCQCEFIEIEKGKILPGLERSWHFFAKKFIARYLKWNIYTLYSYTHRFQKRFKNDFFKLLEADKHSIEYFDVVVIGSDEVFNFAQSVPWGYTLQLYGKISNTAKVISYAGSFGHTTMKDIELYGVREELSDAMKTMYAISVRDKNSFDIVTELTGKRPCLNVDPVLMFDYSTYVKPVGRKNYLIVYTYANRMTDKKEISTIRNFARKNGLKIISIGFYFDWCDETVIPDPFEVLGYIKNAEFVITDTFHGSVMSLKFNCRFAAFIRSSNKQKMRSLLSQFRLENRIIDDVTKLEHILLSPCDYHYANSVLAEERKKSIDYLKSNLMV